jgi:glycosyltransferase involved in cell wall biosynthesis
MKVLLVAPAPPPAGGIESVTQNLVNFFQASQNGHQLLLYNTSHPLRPVTSQSWFTRLYTGIIDSWKTYFSVVQVIKKAKPDIVHLASSSSLSLLKDILIVKAANRLKTPIVLHWHFGRIPELSKKRNWEWKLLLKVAQKSTLSVTLDNKSYSTLLEAGLSNVVNIPNPLAHDVELRVTELFGRPDKRQRNTLIFVGHIIKNKGVFELVEACLQVSRVSELILIGPCEEEVKNGLLKIARQRNKGNWLKFTGELNINQVLDYMAHSPALVLPSHTEGFPMVVIEAMAMGCAIIATDVGAIPEILAIGTNAPCGICIPPHNIERLREAISQVFEGQNVWPTYGKRGMDRVLKTYTMTRVFKLYQIAWEKALNRKS